MYRDDLDDDDFFNRNLPSTCDTVADSCDAEVEALHYDFFFHGVLILLTNSDDRLIYVTNIPEKAWQVSAIYNG